MFVINFRLHYILILVILLFVGCGNGEKNQKKFQYHRTQTPPKTEQEPLPEKASERIDLINKGVGPVKLLNLPDTINQKMVAQGADVFKKMCTACHKVGKKFIGPPPNGILNRRTPEWIMNMILDPENMVANDPLAKQLLIEFNGSPMANQSLTEAEARAILEYFRTLN